MPSLHELVRAHTDLVEDDVAWLQLLMADWQILADLSFAEADRPAVRRVIERTCAEVAGR